jgi:hypothetical protein
MYGYLSVSYQHNIPNRYELYEKCSFCSCHDSKFLVVLRKPTFNIAEQFEWKHSSGPVLCRCMSAACSMSSLIREKKELKAYETLEFIFIGWKVNQPSVVRYEIRSRRLESTVREMWFLSPFSYWKLFWSTALSIMPHCVTACSWDLPSVFCVTTVLLGTIYRVLRSWGPKSFNTATSTITEMLNCAIKNHNVKAMPLFRTDNKHKKKIPQL